MDEDRTLDLVRAAAEVEAFEADVALVASAKTPERPRPSLSSSFWPLGVAAAAAALLFVLLAAPERLAITVTTVAQVASRGPTDEFELRVTFSEPGTIRLVLIDERNERWLVPFDDAAERFAAVVETAASFRCSYYPNPNDGRGPAKTVAVMILASTGGAPTADQLLDAIPEPVMAEVEDRHRLLEELNKIGLSLQSKFDCTVRVLPIPKP